MKAYSSFKQLTERLLVPESSIRLRFRRRCDLLEESSANETNAQILVLIRSLVIILAVLASNTVYYIFLRRGNHFRRRFCEFTSHRSLLPSARFGVTQSTGQHEVQASEAGSWIKTKTVGAVILFSIWILDWIKATRGSVHWTLMGDKISHHCETLRKWFQFLPSTRVSACKETVQLTSLRQLGVWIPHFNEKGPDCQLFMGFVMGLVLALTKYWNPVVQKNEGFAIDRQLGFCWDAVLRRRSSTSMVCH